MFKKDQHENLDLNGHTNFNNSSILNSNSILASISTPPPILLSTSQFIGQINMNSNPNDEESEEDDDYDAEEHPNAYHSIATARASIDSPTENPNDEENEEQSESDASQPHIANNSNLSISSLESASSQTLVQPQRSKTLNDSASIADASKKTNDTSKMSFTNSQGNTQAHNFNFADPKNSNKILEGLNKLRTSGTLCDITLKIESQEFQCHKVALFIVK
jgi:hypothetical protein